jgi:hypothetical protein
MRRGVTRAALPYRALGNAEQQPNGNIHRVASDDDRIAAFAEIDAAAKAFLETVVAEAKLRQAGTAFLDASRGLNQQQIIQRAATRITRGLPHADLGQAARAAWRDAQRLFGWCDISELDPRGRA